jgi:hypothetical protein
MVFAWITSAVAFVLIMLLSSKVSCRITAIKENKNDEIILDLEALFGLVKRRIAIPTIIFKNFHDGLNVTTQLMDKAEHQMVHEENKKIDKQTIKEMFEKFRELLTHCFHFNEWLKDTLKHIHCTRIFWKTEVGVGDAPETAVTTGMVWGLKTSLLAVVFRFIKLDAQPELHVVPQFNQTKFTTQLLLLAYIRVFHILAACLYLLYRVFKVKNGLKTWQRLLFKT